jgi:hypothetical protein
MCVHRELRFGTGIDLPVTPIEMGHLVMLHEIVLLKTAWYSFNSSDNSI